MKKEKEQIMCPLSKDEAMTPANEDMLELKDLEHHTTFSKETKSQNDLTYSLSSFGVNKKQMFLSFCLSNNYFFSKK